MKFTICFIRWWSCIVACAALAAGCSDDDTGAPQQDYGYVQFWLYKSVSCGTGDAAAATRTSDRLEYLRDAAKIKVTLRSGNNDILTPTVVVEAVEADRAEWGLKSDKFQLVAGSYALLGYELYDAEDRSILLYEPDEAATITVIPGGLVSQNLAVKTVERGWVKFQLTKDSSELPETRAGNDGADSHPFHSIMFADITVENQLSGEKTEFKGLKTTHEMTGKKNEGEDEIYYTSVCKTDSIVSLKAGNYKVVGFKTYFDRNKKVYETCNNVSNNTFTVSDNRVTDADVPVTLHVTSGYIADALALKEIWEALDCPNWTSKVQWSFNGDVDLWLSQPNILIDGESGRIAYLSFENTGARGAMPAAIGKLTALRRLSLGTHVYDPGQSAGNGSGKSASERLCELAETDIDAFRRSFTETFVQNGDPLSLFSEELQLSFKLSNIPMKEPAGELRELAKSFEEAHYSNYITSLPEEINQLKKLQMLYIASSPFETLPDDLSGLESLTDLEIYNCPHLTTMPAGIATLPKLISLTFACNENVSAQAMHDGLVRLNNGPSAEKLQLLLIPVQKLRTVPNLNNMKRLSSLNIMDCGVEAFEAAFDEGRPFAQFNARNNRLSELPLNDKGYFIGIDSETETIDFSHNEFTEFPDIFSASEYTFRVKTIDFSFNKIEKIGTHNGTYRGVRAEILNLSHNRFTEFPKELYPSGSVATYLQLQGNGIEKVDKEALEGKNVHMTTTLDLSYNKLTELPAEFGSTAFPYMTGLDLSYNRFGRFPYIAVNNQNLHVIVFRHQRDANGNRCMREWPAGIGQGLYGLRALYLGSNDLRTITDRLSSLIYTLEIRDNPNIRVDVSNLCPYIKAGSYRLIYDPDQDIRGCDDGLILNR